MAGIGILLTGDGTLDIGPGIPRGVRGKGTTLPAWA